MIDLTTTKKFLQEHTFPADNPLTLPHASKNGDFRRQSPQLLTCHRKDYDPIVYLCCMAGVLFQKRLCPRRRKNNTRISKTRFYEERRYSFLKIRTSTTTTHGITIIPSGPGPTCNSICSSRSLIPSKCKSNKEHSKLYPFRYALLAS